jgi:hypothetical protein
MVLYCYLQVFYLLSYVYVNKNSNVNKNLGIVQFIIILPCFCPLPPNHLLCYLLHLLCCILLLLLCKCLRGESHCRLP